MIRTRQGRRHCDVTWHAAYGGNTAGTEVATRDGDKSTTIRDGRIRCHRVEVWEIVAEVETVTHLRADGDVCAQVDALTRRYRTCDIILLPTGSRQRTSERANLDGTTRTE